jgi:hypothetical protein
MQEVNGRVYQEEVEEMMEDCSAKKDIGQRKERCDGS